MREKHIYYIHATIRKVRKMALYPIVGKADLCKEKSRKRGMDEARNVEKHFPSRSCSLKAGESEREREREKEIEIQPIWMDGWMDG